MDPEDVGRSDPASPPRKGHAETEELTYGKVEAVDSAAADVAEDPDRLVDLEYLFAAHTIEVGPIDLAAADTSLEKPSEPAIADPLQGREIRPASAVPASGPLPAADDVDPAGDFESDDGLDALLAEFSAAIDPDAARADPEAEPVVGLESTEVSVPPSQPSSEVIDHASRLNLDAINRDVAVGRTSTPEVDSESLLPGDLAPAGKLFFETLNRELPTPLEPPQQMAKYPAEVFASETAPLPARTRRGDQLSTEQHDAGHSWFNLSSELPILNLTDDSPKPQAQGRAVRFLKRTLLTLLTVAAIAGCLYVALDSIYL